MTSFGTAARAAIAKSMISHNRAVVPLLGLVFVAAFVVFVATMLVRDTLLDPQFYTSALEENLIYDRIYTDLLADPALEETAAALLGDTELEGLPSSVVSMATSTLYLVLPPSTIQSAVEGVITEFTSYLSGQSERIETRLDLSLDLDQEELEGRIVSALLTAQAQLMADSMVAAQERRADVDLRALAAYAGGLGQGRLGEVPSFVLAVSMAGLSESERADVVNALLGPVAQETDGSAKLQVEAALAADDLPGALALASRLLLLERVSEAAARLQDGIENSETLDAVPGAAAYMGESEETVIAWLNRLRDLVTLLDRRLIPLVVLVLVISMALIVWLHSDDIVRVLRAAGGTLLAAGSSVIVLWLVLGLLLRAWLPAQFEGSQAAIPASLESMVRDVLGSLAAGISSSVVSSALIVVAGGIILVALSNVSNITVLFQRVLGPVWPHRKAVLTGATVLIVAIPVLSWVLGENLEGDKQPCNGHVELCDRRFSEVAFAATHNGMSIAEYLWLWPSHDGTISFQLYSGIRAFLIDTHYWDAAASIGSYLKDASPEVKSAVERVLARVPYETREGTHLCHLVCQLGSTSLPETLGDIRNFLEAHPREVVTLIIEDKITPQDTEKAFEDSGLLPYVYVHDPEKPWPTLGELIERGEQLVVMAEEEGPPPSWYHHVWDHTGETPYSFESAEAFNCAPNRGGSDKPLFLLNHWIERVSPSRIDATRVNEYEFLLDRAQRCEEERGQIPNFVAVNFHLAGDVVRVVDALNGVGGEEQH